MKHKFIKMSALALAVSASCSVFAADGTASTTSSQGSFNVQLGGTASRAVRIWGLQDMSLLPTTTTDVAATDKPLAWGTGAAKGVTDKFCVGDSTGGAVKITVTGPPITAGSGTNLKATNTVDSTTASFLMVMAPKSVTQVADANVVSKGTSDYLVNVPAGDIGTLTDLTAACTATNANMRKVLLNPAGTAGPASGIYVGTLTLTATPN